MQLTVKELLDSTEFKKVFRGRSEEYHQRFTAIACRADALAMDLGDPRLLRKLLRPSWNWAAFFGTTFWGVYWRLRAGWIFMSCSFVLAALGAYPTGNLSALLEFAGAALTIILGTYGSSLLFRELIIRARENRLASYSPTYSLALSVLIANIALPFALTVADLGSSSNFATLLQLGRSLAR